MYTPVRSTFRLARCRIAKQKRRHKVYTQSVQQVFVPTEQRATCDVVLFDWYKIISNKNYLPLRLTNCVYNFDYNGIFKINKDEF